MRGKFQGEKMLTLTCIISLSHATMSSQCQTVVITGLIKWTKYNYTHLSRLPLQPLLAAVLCGLQLKIYASITISVMDTNHIYTEEEKSIPFTSPSNQFHAMFLLDRIDTFSRSFELLKKTKLTIFFPVGCSWSGSSVLISIMMSAGS